MGNQIKKKKLFTIGYSSFEIDDFISVLKLNAVDAVADVRSVPYSKYRPEYNYEKLQNKLQRNGIKYVFLGDLCGARINDPECYVDGKVDFSILAMHPKFKEGRERIIKGLDKYNIALLCAEKDPLSCHRMILICRNLRDQKIEISHIIDRDNTISNDECEERLLRLFKLYQPDIFMSCEERIMEAYNLQGKKIAYSDENLADKLDSFNFG